MKTIDSSPSSTEINVQRTAEEIAADYDQELGPPVDSSGQPVDAQTRKTDRMLVLEDAITEATYKAKIDFIKVARKHDLAYSEAIRSCILKAGFSREEGARLRDIPDDDKRFETLAKLQKTDPEMLKAVATCAVAAFEKWNVPQPAPTVEDLLNKGGVYSAYFIEFDDVYPPTARR